MVFGLGCCQQEHHDDGANTRDVQAEDATPKKNMCTDEGKGDVSLSKSYEYTI